MIKKCALKILLIICLSPLLVRADTALTINIIKSVPFGYLGSDGKPSGTHWDYVQAIAKKTGIEMDIALVPRARLIQNLRDGSCDAAILFRSSCREHIVTYVAPLRKIRMVAINRKGLLLLDYEDLYTSRSIGLLQGTAINERFDIDGRLKKETKTSYEQMVRMLKNNRLDTIVGNVIALRHAIAQCDAGDGVTLPGLTLCTKEQWFQFSKKSNHLDKAGRIQKAVAALKAEGVFDTILTHHVGDDWQNINH